MFKKQLEGFKEFAREQGVIGLAIGLVLGTAVNTLVKSLIDNVIMPPIGILLGSAEGLKGLTLDLGKYNGKEAIMSYGVFINDFINFVVIAAVVYFTMRTLRLDKTVKK